MSQRRFRTPDPVTASTLAWLEQASLPLSQLSDPQDIRAALDGLCTRLDGSPAAANTISRKRAVFHGALGYAVELGLLPANPIGKVQWHAPRAAVAISPATVASPAHVRVMLAQVNRPGSPGEFHPEAPTEPCLTVSRYTALLIESVRTRASTPSGQTAAALFAGARSTSVLLA